MSTLAIEQSYEDIAISAGAELEHAPAELIMEWALDRFDGQIAIAASMADAVLIDMAARIKPGVPVLFVDTGYHFVQTLKTRDEVAQRYDVQLLTITPRHTVAEQNETHGPELFARDPDLCCAMRKVEPFERALEPYDAWISGVRRHDSLTRRKARVAEWDYKRKKVKVNPLASWTDDDVERYIEKHNVVVNPLVREGYPSIGCAPCTRRVLEGEDARSGRWAGLEKTECGLHL